MRLTYTLLIVVLATAALLAAGKVLPEITFNFHPNNFINGLIKFQAFALTLSLIVLVAVSKLFPQSKELLVIGELGKMAAKERWLGINGHTTWTKNAFQLLFFISTGTAAFMFLGVKYTDSLSNFNWWFVPFVLLFSLTNSFAEEIIFRYTVVGILNNHHPKIFVQIISAVLFGLPHYFGNPSGIIGVIMAGVLGYVLCKVTIETKGITIAWIIHFVQDVIIFTALMMINIKP